MNCEQVFFSGEELELVNNFLLARAKCDLSQLSQRESIKFVYLMSLCFSSLFSLFFIFIHKWMVNLI